MGVYEGIKVLLTARSDGVDGMVGVFNKKSSHGRGIGALLMSILVQQLGCIEDTQTIQMAFEV